MGIGHKGTQKKWKYASNFAKKTSEGRGNLQLSLVLLCSLVFGDAVLEEHVAPAGYG